MYHLLGQKSQSGLQSVTQLSGNKKNSFLCGQKKIHIIYHHNPRSNRPVKIFQKVKKMAKKIFFLNGLIQKIGPGEEFTGPKLT